MTKRIVGLRFGLRMMSIEDEGQIVGRFVFDIQTKRVEFILGGAVLLLETAILGRRDNIVDENRRGDFAVTVEFDRVERTVVPGCLVCTLFFSFITVIGRIRRHREAIGRCELKGKLPIEALALEFRIVIARVVRDRDQRLRIVRRVSHHRRAVSAAECRRRREVFVGEDIPFV